jgi:hypothetical protein
MTSAPRLEFVHGDFDAGFSRIWIAMRDGHHSRLNRDKRSVPLRGHQRLGRLIHRPTLLLNVRPESAINPASACVRRFALSVMLTTAWAVDRLTGRLTHRPLPQTVVCAGIVKP